jgi:transposase
MSLQPRRLPEVPADTTRAARAAFPRGGLAIRIRDELGEVWADQQFRGLYGARGKPGISPAQLMIVLVLAYAENLTDRQAADMARRAIDWKYALGLALEDPGFDFSVLSEFRARLVAGSMQTEALDVLLARMGELGLVRSGGRARTDSTHVLARLRSLNRLELAGESIRAALEALAAAAPAWLATVIDERWTGVYGGRIDDLHLPASQTKRAALALAYGRDGYRLLDAVVATDAPVWLRELPAVAALRRIWVQQYYRVITTQGDNHGEKVIRREASEQGLPPGRSRLVSPYDLDARYCEKRGTGWIGYKTHLTETCTTAAETPNRGTAPNRGTGRASTPNLITNVATTVASETDVVMTEPIHDSLAAKNLLPAEHVVDSGYTSADLLLAARDRGLTLLGPLLADTSPQARNGGYTTAAFTIDWQTRSVCCPQGATSIYWNPCTHRGADAIVVRFNAATCQTCPVKTRCTTATRSGRQLTLRPRHIHEAVTQARAQQSTDQWHNDYKIRAGVEGTIRQTTHVTGIRRARYLGLPKTTLEHNLAATAINLIRYDAWLTGKPLDRTRTTHLQRIFPQAA